MPALGKPTWWPSWVKPSKLILDFHSSMSKYVTPSNQTFLESASVFENAISNLAKSAASRAVICVRYFSRFWRKRSKVSVSKPPRPL